MRANERLLQVVDLIAADGPVTLTDVAERTGTPKPTVHRLLRFLEERGWAQRHPEGGYVLGLAIVALARRHLASDTLVVAATEPMRELRDELRETVSLSCAVGDARVCVLEFPSPEALRHVHEVGAAAPLHAGASGKLLLAYATEEKRAELLHRPLPAYTEKTRTSSKELEDELRTIRRRGWAISHGERTAGSVAIAVPVRDGLGHVAALAIFAPMARFSAKTDQAPWTRSLQRCAARIEASLGVKSEVTGVA